MAEENSTASHLFVTMTTYESNESGSMSSMLSEYNLYLYSALVVVGVVGTAHQSLILYAMVASRQHKKNLLIVNQNALDGFSGFFLSASYMMKVYHNTHAISSPLN